AGPRCRCPFSKTGGGSARPPLPPTVGPPPRARSNLMALAISGTFEWLEADGLGGFAPGTVNGIRTRRYHALLLAARRPPIDRVVLVNGFDAWVEGPEGRSALSAQRYTPDAVDPEGTRRLESF